MRSGDLLGRLRRFAAVGPPALLSAAIALGLAATSLRAGSPVARQQARYSMGTMFEVVVHHPEAGAADRAIEAAFAEIVRLDRVLSHYRPDSDLSRLNREGGRTAVRVDDSLYEVVEQAIGIARQSGGRFDVTIAPLLRAWQEAYAQGRVPSAAETEAAARCVGYGSVETIPPDRIRFRTDCTELNLGGIGKGYAVERALAILEAHGIRRALVNAGGSTIAASGAPPGGRGWPVRLQASVRGGTTLLLRDASISTSQQKLARLAFASGRFGEIIDPALGGPSAASRLAVSVVAKSATASDALATALLLMEIEEGRALIEQFPGAAALWITPGGELQAAHGASALQMAAR